MPTATRKSKAEPRGKAAKEEMERLHESILNQLAKLGGKIVDDDAIRHEGNTLTLPVGMDYDEAIRFIERKRDDMQAVNEYSQQYKYRPYDGAFCMWNVMKRTFGSVGHRGTMGFWGPNPPAMISVPVDVGRNAQIPWGRFDLPFMPGAVFETGAHEHPELGPLFQLTCYGPKRFAGPIQGVFNAVEKELQTASMYRGKAFDGQDIPEFVDLSGVHPDKVVYSDEVMTQLTASIWGQLRHTKEFTRLGIPLKRAVLLFGPYGTGKTLAGYLTGQEAIAHGWTYLKARPGRDNLAKVLQTARLYQPAVVFYEDVDQVASSEGDSQTMIERLLDDFDGIDAKGTRILIVLTTNHPERIHQGMTRPGRLDDMIEINELDQDGVEKLVRTRIPDSSLDPDIDWAAVFESANRYKPAFVTEFADRSMRYVLVRTGHLDGELITTVDLCNSAASLRNQFTIMEGAKDTREKDSLTDALRDAIQPAAEVAAEAAVRRHVAGKFLVPEEMAAKNKEAEKANSR